jgi:hypothetical protein
MGHGLLHHDGSYHFYELSSFSIALSSIASVSSFFSLAFSSVRSFSRRASDTSSPPYLPFHLKNVAMMIPATNIRRLCPGFLLAQDADDLLLVKP